jgi:hypothetical protein
VPGLRRKALRKTALHTRATDGGIASLFHVERHVRVFGVSAPAIRCCVSQFNYWGERFQSGYAERVSWGAQLYYIVQRGLSWIGVAPRRRRAPERSSVRWRTDPLCLPRPAQHAQAYDMAAYERITGGP